MGGISLRLAQVLSGAFVYLLSFFISDWIGRPLTNSPFTFILFHVLVIAGFAALTMAWHRFLKTHRGNRRPEGWLILGTVILLPVYAVVMSRLIYKPRPFDWAEMLHEMGVYYASFQIMLVSISTYSGTLLGPILAALSSMFTAIYNERKSASRSST